MTIEQLIPHTTFTFTVPEEKHKTRVDLFIAEQFPQYSRSFIQKLFTNNAITIDGKTVKQGSMLKMGQTVVLLVPEPTKRKIEHIGEHDKLSILAKEDEFLIIYKPAGLIVHPPSQAFTGISLTDLLIHEHEEIAQVGIIDRPGIVHRLDANTSGLLIVPTTNNAHNNFSDQFKNRTIKKTYYALVEGHPPRTGTISYPIGRHPIERNRMHAFFFGAETSSSRQAHTDYTVITYFEHFSLVEVKPTTGRTHQIRVHMKAIGHPLLGDELYGKKSKLIKRHALHAYSLAFTFKDKDYYFSCPIDADMKAIISKHKAIEEEEQD